MVEVRGEIVIDRPPEEVFDFVADEENEPRYNPQMRLARKMTEGPIGVGTSFYAEMTRGRRVVLMMIRFTEFDRPHRLAERVEMGTMDLTGGLTLESADTGTRMRWLWSLQPHGALRFMGPGGREHGASAGAQDLDEPQAASRTTGMKGPSQPARIWDPHAV